MPFGYPGGSFFNLSVSAEGQSYEHAFCWHHSIIGSGPLIGRRERQFL